MTQDTLSTMLHLFRVQAALDMRFSSVLGSLHGLAVNELLLLLNLDAAPLGRLKRVDLANALTLAQSSVTRMVAPLEKIGLVRRESDPRDARIGYVALTEAGQRLTADARSTLDRLSEDVFVDRWSGDDVTDLCQLLGRLAGPLPGSLGHRCTSPSKS
jgi:DNA-binding MarR family transcriptional regulator